MLSLAQTRAGGGVRYVLGSAEALPVRSGSVSLLTCGAAFHWFKRDAFLGELRRVLRPDGAAVIYDNFFSTAAPVDGDFFPWYRESFLRKFPRPPRYSEFGAEPAEAVGFRVHGPESCGKAVSMDRAELTSYLITQSNVLAFLEAYPGSLAEVTSWIESEVSRFFTTSVRQRFVFEGPVWFLRPPG
jgi:SAM-dependent methyltransferase